jgi:hypothetical protein
MVKRRSTRGKSRVTKRTRKGRATRTTKRRVGKRKTLKKLVSVKMGTRMASRMPSRRVARASRRTRVFTAKNATKWQVEHQSYGIGPLKRGELGQYGYSSFKPEAERDEALDKAVSNYGSLSVFRKLNALAVYSKNRSPASSRIFKKDRDYVKKTFM